MSIIELNTAVPVLLAIVVPLFVITIIRKWIFPSNFGGRTIKLEEVTNVSKYMRLILRLYYHNQKKLSKQPSRDQQAIFTAYKPDESYIRVIFPKHMIFIRDYKTIKEIHSSDNFADRPEAKMLGMRNGGILQNNGPSWKELRKYTMKTLGQLGFVRKAQMSSILAVEQQDLLDYIQSSIEETGNRIPVHDLFANCVLNVVWSIAAGGKFPRGDPDYTMIKENTEVITKLTIVKLFALELAPLKFLATHFPHLTGYAGIFESLRTVNTYFRNTIKKRKEEREQDGEKSQEKSDFIDCFLHEIEANKNTDKAEFYCEDQLIALLIDLFQAGMDTTHNSLESAIMILIQNPHVMKKVQEEIDEVVGTNTLPTLDHKEKMPYTTATIMEINRMANIIPFNARSAKESCVVGGIHFKKGVFVIPHLYSVRMNEKFWGDPKVFRPERFLDEHNNFIQEKVSRVMAFGGGVRTCPGEQVATWTVFVFLTGILQRYNIAIADKTEVLGMVNDAAITNSVKPFHFTATPR